MAGLSGLSKAAQSGLKQSLAAQSAPPNPQTPPNPQDRQPFNELFYLAMRKVPRVIEQAMEHAPEGDLRVPVLSALLKNTFPILKEGQQLADQIDGILRALFPLSSPSLKQELQTMYSPPVGPAGGAPGAAPAAPGPGGAGAATAQPPGGGQPPMPGDAAPPAA